MSALAEAIISAFDSNAKLVWTAAGLEQAIAKFNELAPRSRFLSQRLGIPSGGSDLT